jgi:hypothetical protein
VQHAPDAHLFTGGPEARAHPPVEEVGTGAKAGGRPRLASVELADEKNETALAGTHVGGLRAELGFQGCIHQFIEHMFPNAGFCG